MIWNRSETIGLARLACRACGGLGLTEKARGQQQPCDCVLRKIFSICHQRFQHAAKHERGGGGVVRLDRVGGHAVNHMRFSRKTEEFMADFCGIAKRALTDHEHTLFKFRYLLGIEPKLLAKRMNISHDNCLYHLRQIEAKLGRAFRETEPFALFPLDEYFSAPKIGVRVPASTPPRAA